MVEIDPEAAAVAKEQEWKGRAYRKEDPQDGLIHRPAYQHRNQQGSDDQRIGRQDVNVDCADEIALLALEDQTAIFTMVIQLIDATIE